MVSMFKTFPPKLQILYRRNLRNENLETLFGWQYFKTSQITGNNIVSYKLYESAYNDGPFVLFKDNILNTASRLPAYKNKIIIRVNDSEIPIPLGQDHYFKLTFVDEVIGEYPIADIEPVILHPPQVNPLDLGEDTDSYVYNWCWDEVHHRWVKGRAMAGSEEVSALIGTTSTNITFNQDVCVVEVANNSPTATIYFHILGGTATTSTGIPIYPQDYYTASRCIDGATGISLISTEAGTDVRVVGHY